jgi:hypothetical protein
MLALRDFAFEDRWSNKKVARIVSMAKDGYSREQIARSIDDGTKPQTISTMLEYWGVRVPSGPRIVVEMSVANRAAIQKRAEQRGLSLTEYCRRFLVCGATKRDTYDQVVPAEQYY